MIAKFRIAIWAAVAVLTVVLIGYGGILSNTAPTGESGSSSVARMGGPFTLTSHKGETVDNRRLTGKPYLVFFGFTNCPEICPTTLYELTDLMAELGPSGDRLTPLFITVDPERDTQAVLVEYMSAFDPRIIALRGDQAATNAAAKAFWAFYKKVPTEASYTMDHTAGVILMDAAGQFAGTLDMQEPRQTRLAKLKKLIEA